MAENQREKNDLDDLFDTEQSTETEILAELMSLSDLDRKTDLTHPIVWSVLQTVSAYLDGKQLHKSAGLIDNFMQMSFRYLISKNRRGRAEYVQAVEAFADELKAKNKTTAPP